MPKCPNCGKEVDRINTCANGQCSKEFCENCCKTSKDSANMLHTTCPACGSQEYNSINI